MYASPHAEKQGVSRSLCVPCLPSCPCPIVTVCSVCIRALKPLRRSDFSCTLGIFDYFDDGRLVESNSAHFFDSLSASWRDLADHVIRIRVADWFSILQRGRGLPVEFYCQHFGLRQPKRQVQHTGDLFENAVHQPHVHPSFNNMVLTFKKGLQLLYRPSNTPCVSHN